MTSFKRFTLFLLAFACSCGLMMAGVNATLRGRVIDDKTGEALVGATIQCVQTGRPFLTDNDGKFSIGSLAPRVYTITASYLGYKKSSVSVNPAKTDTMLVIRMEENEAVLGVATVTGEAKRNTENALVSVQRQSLVVQNGVSAQQISKTQDKDASEVIRRVPGISIIDQKFVMVRGLSQRYNNVWGSRAFERGRLEGVLV